MMRYRDIEKLPNPPVSVHTHSGQKVIKDFAWRTTEELTESYEAWFKHDKPEQAETHALEELADALHFFVELCIFADIGPGQCILAMPNFPPINRRKGSSSDGYWQVTYKLGIAMNFLKNKQWKVSQVQTDETRFRNALLDTHCTMLMLWADLGYSAQHVWDFYFRKAQVNEFRQRSAY
jgi:hypothetical protein